MDSGFFTLKPLVDELIARPCSRNSRFTRAHSLSRLFLGPLLPPEIPTSKERPWPTTIRVMVENHVYMLVVDAQANLAVRDADKWRQQTRGVMGC